MDFMYRKKITTTIASLFVLLVAASCNLPAGGPPTLGFPTPMLVTPEFTTPSPTAPVDLVTSTNSPLVSVPT